MSPQPPFLFGDFLILFDIVGQTVNLFKLNFLSLLRYCLTFRNIYILNPLFDSWSTSTQRNNVTNETAGPKLVKIGQIINSNHFCLVGMIVQTLIEENFIILKQNRRNWLKRTQFILGGDASHEIEVYYLGIKSSLTEICLTQSRHYSEQILFLILIISTPIIFDQEIVKIVNKEKCSFLGLFWLIWLILKMVKW